MKLLTKHFLIFFVGSIFTLAIAGAALWGLKNLEEVTDQLLMVDVRINALANDFAREIAKSRRAEKEFFIFPGNRVKQNKYIVKWNTSYNLVMTEYFEQLNPLLRQNNDTVKLAMVARARELMNDNVAEWKAVTDKFKQTKSYDSVNTAEYGVFKERTHEIEDISVKMINDSIEDVFKSRQKLQTNRNNIENLVTGIFIAAFIWGILAPILFARRMVSVIATLTKVTDEISRGQIGAKLEINRKDEFGDLATAIVRMQRSLQIMFRKLKAAS